MTSNTTAATATNAILDELEELELEATRTVTANDDFTDLDDLDTLLEESTQIYAAKKAQKQGRKLTLEQAEILKCNALAEAANIWDTVEAVAHFIQTTCDCGQTHRRFNSWYKLLQHRQQKSSARLVRCDDHEGLPASQYTTVETVGYCHECLGAAGLPFASTAEISMLTSLGEELQQDDRQLELDLLAGEIASDVMLAELDDEVEEIENALV